MFRRTRKLFSLNFLKNDDVSSFIRCDAFINSSSHHQKLDFFMIASHKYGQRRPPRLNKLLSNLRQSQPTSWTRELSRNDPLKTLKEWQLSLSSVDVIRETFQWNFSHFITKLSKGRSRTRYKNYENCRFCIFFLLSFREFVVVFLLLLLLS